MTTSLCRKAMAPGHTMDKSTTPGAWRKACVQVSIRAAFMPWEHNGKHLVLDYTNIYAGMWTPSYPATSCCPLQVARTACGKAHPGWWLPTGNHLQGQLWAFAQGSDLMVWTPDTLITGMSRALVFLLGGSWMQRAILTSRDMTDHFSGCAWCSGIQ